MTGALGTSTAVAVAASPACSRLVHTYVDRVERNLVSKATLKRWHDWGVGHPNWHPSRLAHRAKFRKVRQEVVSTLAVACPFISAPAAEIALLKPDLDTFVLPAAPTGFSGDTLTPPIVAPAPQYVLPGSYPISSIGPVIAGGGGGGGAAGGGGGGSAPTGTTTTSPPGGIVLPPIDGAPVSTPIAIAPVTTPTSTPIDTPVPITPVTTPTGTTPGTTTTPIPPVDQAPIPEPSSIVLTLTAVVALVLFQLRNMTVNQQS